MPNADEIYVEVQKFYNVARFPSCMGAIDCTHIKIKNPGGANAELYRNRKGYFSFNVQVVCNADLKIMNIVSRWHGSAHDANIFRNSRLRANLEAGVYANHCLVGDSGYGIKRYLLTPLNNANTREEQLYNESQIRTRNCVERCFGVWKRRFPILATGIRLNLDRVEAVIVAAAVLHNVAISANDNLPAVNEVVNEDVNFLQNFNQGALENHDVIDNHVRLNLINNYFANLNLE